MSSSTHSNNRANNILVLGKDFIQGINGTTIYAEKMYSINFSATRARFILSLHYNGDNIYLFVNGKEMIKFKAKDSKIVSYPFCLGNISIDFSNTNMEKTGLYGSVYLRTTSCLFCCISEASSCEPLSIFNPKRAVLGGQFTPFLCSVVFSKLCFLERG